jgi:hypothetical protein|nr:MAG TPA: Avd-like-generating retroelement protein [Caudoviricetes sp.]
MSRRIVRKNMSVLARNRSTSAMEFLNTAHELEKFTIEACHRENVIPKRYRLSKGKDLMESAKIVNNNVIYANSVFPRTKAEYQRRIKFQKRAIMEIQIMLKDLRLLSEILPISDSVLEKWTGYLINEEGYIKAWMQSDKGRFDKLE